MNKQIQNNFTKGSAGKEIIPSLLWDDSFNKLWISI